MNELPILKGVAITSQHLVEKSGRDKTVSVTCLASGSKDSEELEKANKRSSSVSEYKEFKSVIVFIAILTTIIIKCFFVYN